MKEIIAKWNTDYYVGELSQACLEELDKIDTDNCELMEFLDTWTFYFYMAGGHARNISPLGASFLPEIAKSYMPSLWANIPPITRGGRLRLVDRIAHDVLGITPDQAIHFLDVGCGYPPLPTVETAETCPKWSCVGIDPNFPVWILFDDEDNASCFDEAGTLVYIQYLQGGLQPALNIVQRDRQRRALEWERIHQNPTLREEWLLGERLLKDPAKHYERDNLSFRTSTLTGLSADQTFDLIRCMNVFPYFDGQAILDNIRHAKSLLADLGVFICGISSEWVGPARYLTYQKHGDALTPQLFGMDLNKFSQREANGWWAFYKDQPDTLFLAKVVRLVSDNGDLFDHVNSVIDRIEHELGHSHRDSDGYLHQTGFLIATTEYEYLLQTLKDECGQEITTFLEARGLCAEITPFGHLLIDLSRSSPEHYEQYFPVL